MGNRIYIHRLNKNLNLNWNTKPIASNKTSPQTTRPYLLEKIEELRTRLWQEDGVQGSGGETPFGILGH